MLTSNEDISHAVTIQARVIRPKRLNYGECRAAAARPKGQLCGNTRTGDHNTVSLQMLLVVLAPLLVLLFLLLLL